MGRALVLALVILVALTGAQHGTVPAVRAEEDLVHIKSHVSYDIHPDQGPVRVAWDVSIQNNDPQTQKNGGRGNQVFYETFSFPVLTGASALSATSADGTVLRTDLTETGTGPVATTAVTLDRRLFYQDSYDLHLQYEIPESRHTALVVIPAYAFVPLVAGGDEATVDVSAPGEQPWSTSIEAADCTKTDATLTCTGADSVFLAGVAEVARPDLTATRNTEVQLRDQKVPVNITYFQGEDGFAQHVSELATAALPVIEDIYGVTYSGPPAINVSERVRQVILGYEGLTSCDATGCAVNISPTADDYTVLHELAHLWSGLYSNRWLSEGFAQYVSLKAAGYLPEGLVTGEPPARPQPSVDLQLDDWGEVKSVIGAAQDQLAVENAGYFRSQRFLDQLEFELGVETLRRTNQAISRAGRPADSRRFMDVLEEVSGRDNDSLFQEWVFPSTMATVLVDRREARDRLTNVIARAQEDGLKEDVPDKIQEMVDAWKFHDAFGALDKAEGGLDTYSTLKGDLSRLRGDSAAAGLALGDDIEKLISDWEFEGASAKAKEASEALTAYNGARDKVAAGRNVWERFGLLGSDPEASLERAAAAFNDGDYGGAIDHANKAVDTINDASETAMRRVLIVTGIFSVFAIVILGAVWLSRRRSPDFA